MQNPDMARALGVDTRNIYLLTFGAGSALAGLTGALYAPTTTIVPLMGTQFVDVALITVVIGGGANPIIGALSSAALLAAISTPLSSVCRHLHRTHRPPRYGACGDQVSSARTIRILAGAALPAHGEGLSVKTPNANTRHTIRRLLNGPQELGHRPVFWTCFAAVAVIALAYPTFGSAFGLSNLANFCLYVPMALGLALLWGYNGVLSFGQTAFFVIAGYVYGLVAGNLIDIPGGTLLALTDWGRLPWWPSSSDTSSFMDRSADGSSRCCFWCCP